MITQFSQIKWGRVTLTALAVYILSFLTVILIVTGYATSLAIQARGAPDQKLIAAFADQNAPWIGPFSLILFTFLGAMRLARRVETALPIHGIILGALAGLVNFVFGSLGLSDLALVILTIGAGWFGSNLSKPK